MSRTSWNVVGESGSPLLWAQAEDKWKLNSFKESAESNSCSSSKSLTSKACIARLAVVGDLRDFPAEGSPFEGGADCIRVAGMRDLGLLDSKAPRIGGLSPVSICFLTVSASTTTSRVLPIKDFMFFDEGERGLC